MDDIYNLVFSVTDTNGDNDGIALPIGHSYGHTITPIATRNGSNNRLLRLHPLQKHDVSVPQ